MEVPPAEPHSPESRIRNPVKLVEDIRYEWGIRLKELGTDPSDPHSIDLKTKTMAWDKLFEDSAFLKGSKEAAQDTICGDWATSLRICARHSPNDEIIRQTRELLGITGGVLPTKKDLVDFTNGRAVGVNTKRAESRREPLDPDDAAREAQTRRASRTPDDWFEAAKARTRAQEETEERKQKEKAEQHLKEALAQQTEYLRQEEERRKAEDEAQAKAVEEEGRLWRERRRSPSLLGTGPAPEPETTAEPNTASEDKLREAAEYFRGLRGNGENNSTHRTNPFEEAKKKQQREKEDKEKKWLEQNRPIWQTDARQFWQEVWKLLPIGPFSTARDITEARANGLMRGVARVIEKASDEFVKPEQTLVEVQELVKNLATTPHGRVQSLNPAGWTAFLDQYAENRSGIVRQIVGRDTEKLQKARRKVIMATHPDKTRNTEVDSHFIASFVAWFNSSADTINRH